MDAAVEAEKPKKKRNKRVKRHPKGHPRERVILRIRMSRALLERIRDIANHDRTILGEEWNMSDACRETLFDWIQRREGEIRLAATRGFSGDIPIEGLDRSPLRLTAGSDQEDLHGDDDDALDAEALDQRLLEIDDIRLYEARRRAAN